MAHWVVQYTTFVWDMHVQKADVMVKETVTEADERFRIAGWGSAELSLDIPADAVMTNQDPGVVFFTPGYWSLACLVKCRHAQMWGRLCEAGSATARLLK